MSKRAERAGDAHVAAERHVHAGADGGAVHRRQRGQRAAGDPQEALVDRRAGSAPSASARLPRLAPAQNAGGAPVTTTAPTPSSASMRVHGGHDLLDHRGGQGVALGGVVQREGGDAVGDVEHDEAHGWDRGAYKEAFTAGQSATVLQSGRWPPRPCSSRSSACSTRRPAARCRSSCRPGRTTGPTRAIASAAAPAVAERRLVARPGDARRAWSGLRPRRSARRRARPSVRRGGDRPPAAERSRPPPTATVRTVLATDAVAAAPWPARGEDAAASPVTPLLAARSVAATLTRDELAVAARRARGRGRRLPQPHLEGAAGHRARHSCRRRPPSTAASAWGIERVGALAAWGAYNARGKGVKVGVLDTGVDAEHPDLKGKVANWAEFDADGKRVTGSTPHDTDRHGTHVCGTIAGGNASGKWIGVAPEARLAVGLVLDGEQGGSDAQVLAGIDWALERNVDVISMSLGALVIGPETPGTYTRAIVECFLRGVPVVAAIGQRGRRHRRLAGQRPVRPRRSAPPTSTTSWPASAVAARRSSPSPTSIRPGLLPLPYPKPDVSAPGRGGRVERARRRVGGAQRHVDGHAAHERGGGAAAVGHRRPGRRRRARTASACSSTCWSAACGSSARRAGPPLRLRPHRRAARRSAWPRSAACRRRLRCDGRGRPHRHRDRGRLAAPARPRALRRRPVPVLIEVTGASRCASASSTGAVGAAVASADVGGAGERGAAAWPGDPQHRAPLIARRRARAVANVRPARPSGGAPPPRSTTAPPRRYRRLRPRAAQLAAPSADQPTGSRATGRDHRASAMQLEQRTTRRHCCWRDRRSARPQAHGGTPGA